jgi:hypothetical protein
MRTSARFYASALLVLAGCGSGSSDSGPTASGPATVVVNASTFGPAGVSKLVSHLTTPASSTASLAFVSGPLAPPIGQGSGEWRIGADGSSGLEVRFKVLDGVPLANVTSLSFWTFVQSDSSGIPIVSVNLSLRLDWDGDGLEDDRIYFEPIHQHTTPGIPDQGLLLLGAWQSWDALTGGWWSNNDPAFFLPALGTLTAYLAAHPAAKVVTHTDSSGGTRLNAGYGAPGWNNFIGNADALEVGILGNVTTFDLDP